MPNYGRRAVRETERSRYDEPPPPAACTCLLWIQAPGETAVTRTNCGATRRRTRTTKRRERKVQSPGSGCSSKLGLLGANFYGMATALDVHRENANHVNVVLVFR